MRYPRFIEISLLLTLASSGCDGDTERDAPEEQVLDMSLLEQDDEGEWHAPIDEGAISDLTAHDDPSGTYFSMHNHLLGINGGVSYWSIHRDGGHGTVCGFLSDFSEQCANVSAYLGGSTAVTYNIVYCAGGFVKNATCAVW